VQTGEDLKRCIKTLTERAETGTAPF